MRKIKSDYIGHTMLIKWNGRNIPVLCVDAMKQNRFDGLRIRLKNKNDFKSNALLAFFDNENIRVAMINWRIRFYELDIVTVFDCIDNIRLRECNRKIKIYKEKQKKALRKYKAFTSNNKTYYKCTNPKPYQGGGFTPK